MRVSDRAQRHRFRAARASVVVSLFRGPISFRRGPRNARQGGGSAGRLTGWRARLRSGRCGHASQRRRPPPRIAAARATAVIRGPPGDRIAVATHTRLPIDRQTRRQLATLAELAKTRVHLSGSATGTSKRPFPGPGSVLHSLALGVLANPLGCMSQTITGPGDRCWAARCPVSGSVGARSRACRYPAG